MFEFLLSVALVLTGLSCGAPLVCPDRVVYSFVTFVRNKIVYLYLGYPQQLGNDALKLGILALEFTP